MIATGSMDNSVRLWNSKTAEALGVLKGHSKWITALAWEPCHLQQSGRPRLASSSKDATVRVWDAISKRIETVLSGHKGSVSGLRWGGLVSKVSCFLTFLHRPNIWHCLQCDLEVMPDIGIAQW